MKHIPMAIALLLAASAATAHDFWIQPARFTVAAGVPTPVTFQVGHGTDRQRWGLGVDRIVQLSAISAGGRRDQRGLVRPGGAADFVTRFPEPGLQILVMQTNYAFSDLPAVRFNDFAKEEGLLPAIEARRRRGATNSPGRERYSRRAKALIQVGSATPANQFFATRPVGLKLEIVPERSPYFLGRLNRLPVRVLYRGRRLANATVKLTNLANDAKPLSVVRTDRAGRAAFTLPAAGDYLINVIWTEPVSGDPKADFDTTFSSLTFGYRPGR